MHSARASSDTGSGWQYLWPLAAAGAVAVLYWPTFVWMAQRFLEPGTSYSHGFLVPVVSGYLVWQRRQALSALPYVPSRWALPGLIGSVVLHVLATWWQVHFLSGFSLIGAVWSVTAYLWGARVARAVAFPVLFFLFMVPLPSVWLIHASFRLKLIAAELATTIVGWMGVPAVREGSAVQLPNCRIIVDDTCSGLRSLIALIALAAVLTQWLSIRTPIRRAVLIAAAVPIAVAANWLRVTAALLVGFAYGAQAAGGRFHDLSGIGVFLVALAGLAAVARRLAS